MPDIDSTTLAYVAGIIDGEGSLTTQLNESGTHTVVLRVSMILPDVPRFLHRVLGGTISQYPHKKTSTGTICTWAVAGIVCKRVLEAIRPYVILKSNHIPIALAIISVTPGRGFHSSLKEKIVQRRLSDMLRALNHHGGAVRA